jgi:RNA recognition motif-containing protein
MPAGAEAQSAINGLNEKELKGRALKVNEARPQRNREGGGGGGGHQRY